MSISKDTFSEGDRVHHRRLNMSGTVVKYPGAGYAYDGCIAVQFDGEDDEVREVSINLLEREQTKATNGDAWGSREIAKHVLEVAECSDCVAPANFYDAEAMLRLAAQRLEEQDDEIERLRAMEKRAQDAHLVAYGEESQVIGYILYGERD